MTTAAFKEWSRICLALGAGQQSIILRKGGIHERSGGFQWDHDEFWLFPTRFHEEGDALTAGAPGTGDATAPRHEEGTPESVEIRHFARIVEKHQLPKLDQCHALEGLHFWKPGVLEDRFEWSDERCLWLAVLRIYEAPEAVVLPWQKNFGGCRSWLDLPAVPEGELRPVLDDEAHQQLVSEVAARLGATAKT